MGLLQKDLIPFCDSNAGIKFGQLLLDEDYQVVTNTTLFTRQDISWNSPFLLMMSNSCTIWRIDKPRSIAYRQRPITYNPLSSYILGLVQLIHSDYPLVPLLTQLENDSKYTIPEPAGTSITVSRQGYQLKVTNLSDWQADLLSHTKAQPCHYQKAISDCAKRINMALPELQTMLAMWLPYAIEAGLIVLTKC